MGKARNNRNLGIRSAGRALLVISLAASLAAFGCTTNRTLGDGDPTTAGAGVRTPPTGGITTGSETGSPVPPSMTSSYNRSDLTRSVAHVPATQVADYMAGVEAAPRVRVLGPSAPGAAPVASASAAQVTGQFVNPAVIVNPQLTINSSSSSAPIPAIASGAGAEGGAVLGGVVDADGFVAGVVDEGLVVGGNVVTPSGAVFLPSGAPVTPTSAALPVPPGAFVGPGAPTGVAAGTPPTTAAATTLTPTTSSSLNPPLTAVSGATAVAPRTAASQPLRVDAARRAAAARTTTSAGAQIAPLRVMTESDGRVVVTNVEPRR